MIQSYGLIKLVLYSYSLVQEGVGPIEPQIIGGRDD